MEFHLLYGKNSFVLMSTCLVGRREGDILLKGDDLVSGKHAKFHTENKKIFITDLGSSNGTWVNSKVIEKNKSIELFAGDEVIIGTCQIKVHAEKSEHTMIDALDVSSFASPQAEEPEKAEHTKIEALDVGALFPPQAEEPEKAEHTKIEALDVGALFPPQSEESEKAEHTMIESLDVASLAPPQTAATIAVGLFAQKAKEDIPRAESPKEIKIEAPPQLRMVAPLPLLKPLEKELSESVEEERLPLKKKTKLFVVCASIALGGILFFAFHKRSGDKIVVQEESSVENVSPLTRNPEAVRPKVALVNKIAENAPEEQKLTPSVEESVASSHSTPQVTSAAQVDEAPLPAPAAVLSEVREVVVKKVVARKKVSPKNKAFKENGLLVKLEKIEAEMKRTKSLRVREALLADALDLATQHYKGLVNVIKVKWNHARSLASSEKNKAKVVLQAQLNSVRKREKMVTSKIPDYLNGKIKSPF